MSYLILSAWLMTVATVPLSILAINWLWPAGGIVESIIAAGEENSSKGRWWRPSRKHPFLWGTMLSMSLAGFYAWVSMLALCWSLIPKLQSMCFSGILLLGTLSVAFDLSQLALMLAAHGVAGNGKTR